MEALRADMHATLGAKRRDELWKDAAKRPPGPVPGKTRKYLETDEKMLEAYDGIRAGSVTTDNPNDKDAPTEVLARKIAEVVFERWAARQAGSSIRAITKRLTRLIKKREKEDKAHRQAQEQALLAPRWNALMVAPGTDPPD